MASFPKLYKLGWENLNQAGQQAIKLTILLNLLVIFIWCLCTIRLDISNDRDEEDVDSPFEEEAADEQSDDG